MSHIILLLLLLLPEKKAKIGYLLTNLNSCLCTVYSYTELCKASGIKTRHKSIDNMKGIRMHHKIFIFMNILPLNLHDFVKKEGSSFFNSFSPNSIGDTLQSRNFSYRCLTSSSFGQKKKKTKTVPLKKKAIDLVWRDTSAFTFS